VALPRVFVVRGTWPRCGSVHGESSALCFSPPVLWLFFLAAAAEAMKALLRGIAELRTAAPPDWARQNSATSLTRQRVHRTRRNTGCGASPVRTASCHQLTETDPAAAQVAASVRATSARSIGSACEEVDICDLITKMNHTATPKFAEKLSPIFSPLYFF